jgi:hypothetical protein
LLGGVIAQPVAAQLPDVSGSAERVIVSRSEVRVYFAPELVPAWSSSPTPSAGGEPRSFFWIAHLDGPTTLGLRFRSALSPALTLDSIVRAGRAVLCRQDMATPECSSADVVATVENGRIVLTYRDTVEIRQSFGLRPTSVQLLVNVPAEMGGIRIFNAPVEYVDPPILLDSLERRVVSKERHRREASINSYWRGIEGGSHGRTLSMAVGDSVDVWIQYYHCLVDVCGSHDFMDREPRDWGRWLLSGSSVVTLHRSNVLDEANSGFPSNDQDRARKLVARRPGRTILRVSGVQTAADTMPSRTPLDSIMEREIVVTPARRRP